MIYAGMINLGLKWDLGRFEGELPGELDTKEESSSLVGAVFGPYYISLPCGTYHLPLALWSTALWGVLRKVKKLLSEAH